MNQKNTEPARQTNKNLADPLAYKPQSVNIVQKDSSQMGEGDKSGEIITKIEEQPWTNRGQQSPTLQNFPLGKIPSGSDNEMQGHLNHLESILRSRSAPLSQPEFKNPSLSIIPEAFSKLGATNSALLAQNVSPVFPNFGLSEFTNANSAIRYPSFVQQKQNFVQNANQLSNQSSYIQDMQIMQSQMNRINLLNSLINQQQTQTKTESATKSARMTELGFDQNRGTEHRMQNFYSEQIPQYSLGRSMSPNPIRPHLDFKGELNKHLHSMQDVHPGRSPALSDGSSPKHVKHFSNVNRIGTVPTLWEIPELKKREHNPSLTSLDDEINESSLKLLTQTTNPTFHMSLNSQFEGLHISKDNTGDILSKRSYGSVNKAGLSDAFYLHSLSLPDLANLQQQKQKFSEKMEEEGNTGSQSYRYGTPSTPGVYSKEERANKILKYKKKINKWRVAHPINRSFLGRKATAGIKPRIKGKFVSNEEYKSYMQKEKDKKASELDSSEKTSQSCLDIKIDECP